MSKTYRVSIGDRQRDRIIRTETTPADAARAAVGSRLLTCREESRSMGRDPIWVYEVAVQTGPTRSGSTPFANVRVYVSAE